METSRLKLRPATIRDAGDILEMRNSEFVLKYNGMKPITLEALEAQLSKEADGVFYLERKETGKVIGNVDLSEDSLRHGVNALCVSYYLKEDCTGQGYMSEALREILRHAFEDRKTDLLAVRVFDGNEASLRLVGRLGFQHEGCIRRCVKGHGDIVYDDHIFSMLKEEYFAASRDPHLA